MRQVNFYLDLVADEDRSKADVELRWMVQNARGKGRFVERFLFLLVIAGAAAGGVYWERGYKLFVYQCTGGVVGLCFLLWIISKIRSRKRFKNDWEMAVLKWHGARAKIKEAIRIGHPKEAMSHARDEAKARDEIMELLRL
jgi:hypothetical protein